MSNLPASRPDLIAIDWGTTSWRGALIAADGQVISQRSAPRGILSVENAGFTSAWHELCGDWLTSGARLCLMSGMVGSRQGWIEAPYVACPAGFDALAGQIAWVEDGLLPIRTGIVAGMRCERGGLPDVMRGEEVQVFGAAALSGLDHGTFVLPGTHSKWVVMKDGAITGFRSAMTGELYALLRSQSILSRLMPQGEDTLDEAALRRGVRAAQTGELLSLLFSARTLGLFDRLPAAALPSYLSGLLLGEEFRTAAHVPGQALVLVGSPSLTARYHLAAQELGLRTSEPSGVAAWAGLRAIASRLGRT